MDVKYINPFIESIDELFTSMLDCTAQISQVKRADPVLSHHEIIGLIGLSGPIKGTVALILPVPTALAIVTRFVGAPVEELDESVIDAVAELVNIIAGGAKAKIHSPEGVMTLSIPNVIRGMGNTILAPSWATWIELHFSSDLGFFNLRITLSKERP